MRETQKVTYKQALIRPEAHFSAEVLQFRKKGQEMFHVMKRKGL